jgi:hypothetical protein
MKNIQAHLDELVDLMETNEFVGIDKETGKLRGCDSMSCRECEFDKLVKLPDESCADPLVNWMFREWQDEVS